MEDINPPDLAPPWVVSTLAGGGAFSSLSLAAHKLNIRDHSIRISYVNLYNFGYSMSLRRNVFFLPGLGDDF